MVYAVALFLLRHVFRLDDILRVAEMAGDAQFTVFLESFVQFRLAEGSRRGDHALF